MPRGDRTGPMGMGPKTGRGLGLCNGYAAAGGAGFGGLAAGFGRGRGQRRMCCTAGFPARLGGRVAAASALDEKALLRSRAEALEAQLQQLKQRLSELDSETE